MLQSTFVKLTLKLYDYNEQHAKVRLKLRLTKKITNAESRTNHMVNKSVSETFTYLLSIFMGFMEQIKKFQKCSSVKLCVMSDQQLS